MAITLPKYLENPGGNLNTILQDMMSNKQKQNELSETGRYHLGQLGIQQQAENREGRAQKALEQWYKDAHAKAQQDAIIREWAQKIAKSRYPGFSGKQNGSPQPTQSIQVTGQNIDNIQQPASVEEPPARVFGQTNTPSPYKKMEAAGQITPMPQADQEAINKLKQGTPQESQYGSEEHQEPIDPAVAAYIKKETGLDLAAQTPLQEELTKQDAKQIGEFGTTLTGLYETQSSLNNLQHVVTDPVMQTMKNNPIYWGHDISYYKRAGSPEQQKILGYLIAYTKDLYASLSKKFKGAFRVGEQKLFNDMLVDEKDTVPTMLGKIEAMRTMNETMIARLSLADRLSRSGMYSPNESLNKADKLINGDKIREQIHKQITGEVESRKYPDVKGKTWVKFPSGEIFNIDNKDIPIALSPENKGVVLKKGNQNG